MNVHFIGIGGIGVSALAKYHLAHGDAVTGSDLAPSEITEELENLGAAIAIGSHPRYFLPTDAEKVVYTAATAADNLELDEARKRGIPCQIYAEAIAEITRQYKTITISGAHGKSTTTALAGLVLEEGYCDPTVIVGTKVKEFGNSNFRNGKGPYLVLEADEYNKTFLHYSPFIAAVTNIDAEHLDTYQTIQGVEAAFEEYLGKVPEEGTIILNRDDKRLRRIGKKFGRVSWYSLESPEAPIVRSILRIPGEHNVSNALAALHIGRAIGIPESAILKALGKFQGAWRRFELRGMAGGAFIFSDYGHHPTEIKATLHAARAKFPFRRIWCVFQPHHYERLAGLWKDFIKSFDFADRVALLPVYEVAGREKKSEERTVSSELLARKLAKRGKNASYAATFEEARELILEEIRPGDVVLMMGAGDIYGFTNELVAVNPTSADRAQQEN